MEDAEVVTDGGEAAVASHDEADVVIDPAVEAVARSTGWRPKDEWSGDPKDWVPPDKFIERGQEMLRTTSAENKKLRAELSSLKTETTETIARIERMSKTALQRQRADLEQRFEEVKRQAVQQGDTRAYEKANESQKKALDSFDKEAAEQSKQPDKSGAQTVSSADKEVLQSWLAGNPWFNSSNMLRGAADDAHAEIMAQHPGMSLADRLAKVRERVAEMFPDKFGATPRGNGAAAVEGAQGRDGEAGDTGGALWSKVPVAARQQAEHFIKQERIYDSAVGADPSKDLTPKQLAKARELYAKEYLEEAV